MVKAWQHQPSRSQVQNQNIESGPQSETNRGLDARDLDGARSVVGFSMPFGITFEADKLRPYPIARLGQDAKTANSPRFGKLRAPPETTARAEAPSIGL